MLQKFEEHLQTSGKSPLTIRSYIGDIKKHVKLGTINLLMSQINLDILLKQASTARSKHRNLCSLKKYAKFLLLKKMIPKIPDELTTIELPPVKIKIVPIPTQQQTLDSIKECKDLETTLIASLLYSTGARIDSVSNLKVEDIKDDVIFFRVSKGDKEYESILVPQTKELLKKYLVSKNITTGYLFLNFKKQRASADSLRLRLKKYMVNYIKPHSYRHRLASDLINSGVDLIDIKEVLNHSSINTTTQYIHFTNDQRKKRLLGKHPML